MRHDFGTLGLRVRRVTGHGLRRWWSPDHSSALEQSFEAQAEERLSGQVTTE